MSIPDFQLLQTASQTEQVQSLRDHLRPGRFWKLATKPGTLAYTYLAALAPGVNYVRASINRAFLAMLPGMSADTLAGWEILCGTHTAVGIPPNKLTDTQRQSLLWWWLFAPKNCSHEAMEGLAGALGGTITWYSDILPGGYDFHSPFTVGCKDRIDLFGCVGNKTSNFYGCLNGFEANYVEIGLVRGLTSDAFAAFLALYPKLKPAHLKYSLTLWES